MTKVGRMLGLDFGTKRLGIALSDEMGWSAEPLEVWRRKDIASDMAHLRALIDQHEVVGLVIGVPFRLDGSTGPSAERALEFIEAVAAAFSELPLTTRDEALTSFEAEARMKDRGLDAPSRKAWVDAYAASVILQDHLTAQGTGLSPDGEGTGDVPPRPRKSRGRRR